MLACSYCWQPVGTGVKRDRQFVSVSQTFSARIWPGCRSRNRFFYHVATGSMQWLLPGWRTSSAIEWITVGAIDVVAVTCSQAPAK